MTTNHYIIDTSSLINLSRYNPIDVYPTVWRNLTNLRKRGLLHSSIEVYNEVSRKDDSLKDWVKANKQMFIEESATQLQFVSEILSKYPSIVDVERRFEADPWLIALALEMRTDAQQKLTLEKIIIVTDEKLKGNKVRIPFICQNYDLDFLNIFDMFREEGWKF
ncbi:MAG: DUF4411 family protein [Candidatus Heimdallarchaeota archaeon]